MASTEVVLSIKCDDDREDEVVEFMEQQAKALRTYIDSLCDPGAYIALDAPLGFHETY